MVSTSGWNKWSLGKLVSETKTTIQTGPFGTVLSASEFVDYGIPVVSVREIREGFIRITDETPCVTEETFSRLSKYSLSEKDIVFARKGSVDRSALIPGGRRKYFLGSDGIRIRFDQDAVVPELMLYIFQSPSTKQFLVQSAYGTTMAGLNEKILCSLEFYLPNTVTEQRDIAHILKDIDKQLVVIAEMIDKKKTIKQGAMQELLTGKKRLPGFSGEWEFVVLGEASAFYNGGTPSKKRDDWWNGNIPWVSSSDLCDGSITAVNIDRFITHDAVEHSPTRICPKNAVLVVTRVGVGKVAVAPCELCTSQDFTTIVSNRHNPYFLAYMLVPILKDLAAQAQGTSIKGVTVEEIQKIRIPTPTMEEQNQIVNILADVDSEIEALEQKLEKYRQLKQGMMQQLLTGKIRLV